MELLIMRYLLFSIMIITGSVLLSWPAAAEVRFGKNVRIGGHDVSNQTFNKKRRGVFYIHNTNPPNEGCRWRNNGDGSRTKVCHLKRRPSR
jgi:hypothetical protein